MSNEELPKGWEVKSLREIAQIVSGSTPSREKPEYWQNGTILWATPTDITRDSSRILSSTTEKITQKGLNSCGARLLPPGSLLMTSRATLGEMKIAETQICTNQGFKSLVPNNSINIWYLFYQMQHSKLRFSGFGIGSTFLEVNKKDTESFTIPYAPLPEQRKIARILTTVDNLIEKTEALIAKYQAIKQGMMHDLFTRGVDEHGQLRPTYKEAPELYKESWLGFGMIPASWREGEIEDYCEIHNNLRFPISEEVRADLQGDYPYYGPTGILDYINEYRINGKYVLIGEDGDHFLKHAKQPMTILVEGRFNVNNHAHVLRGKNGCATEWFHTFFCHRDVTLHVTRQGAGRLKLNKASLLKIPMLVPQEDEQTRIYNMFQALESRMRTEDVMLSKLNLLKTGLMQDLLTGKVRVKPDTETDDV